MRHTLINIIDEGNVDELREYIKYDPELNFEHFLPNGMSILWLAMHPKNGNPSIELINVLLQTNSISPNQNYLRRTINYYMSPEVLTLWIQYQNRQERGVQVAAPVIRQLATIANDNQNTHDPIIMKGIDKAIISLYKKYGENLETQKSVKLRSEIEAAQRKYALAYPQKRINLQKAWSRILKSNEETRSYPIIEKKEETGPYPINEIKEKKAVELNLQNTFLLVWCALKDKNPASFVDGISFKPDDVLEREHQLFDSVAESEAVYGTSPACWTGTRNLMVISLACKHVDVVLNHTDTPSTLSNLYVSLCSQLFKDWQENNPSLFGQYLSQHIFSHLFVEKQDESPLLRQRIQSAHASILLQIDKHVASQHGSLIPDDISETLSNFKNNGLVHGQNSLIQALEFFCTTFHKSKLLNLSDEDRISIHATLEKSKLYLTTNLLIVTLLPYLQIKALIKTLKDDPLYSLFFAKEPDFENRLNNSRKSIISEMITEGKQTLSSRFLLSEMASTIQQNASLLLPWFEALTVAQKEAYCRYLWQFETSSDWSDSKQILKITLTFALQEGVVASFPFTEEIVISNIDLRGCSLDNVDLTRVRFNECDLRLTKIICNPSFRATHLHNNQYDQGMLLHAIINDLDVQAERLIQAGLVTKNELLQKSHKGITPLLAAALKNKWTLVELLLKCDECDTEILSQQMPPVISESKSSLLHILVLHQKTDLIQQVIDHPKMAESLLSSTNKNKETPLHLACYVENPGVLNCLLSCQLISKQHFKAKDNAKHSIVDITLHGHPYQLKALLLHPCFPAESLSERQKPQEWNAVSGLIGNGFQENRRCLFVLMNFGPISTELLICKDYNSFTPLGLLMDKGVASLSKVYLESKSFKELLMNEIEHIPNRNCYEKIAYSLTECWILIGEEGGWADKKERWNNQKSNCVNAIDELLKVISIPTNPKKGDSFFAHSEEIRKRSDPRFNLQFLYTAPLLADALIILKNVLSTFELYCNASYDKNQFYSKSTAEKTKNHQQFLLSNHAKIYWLLNQITTIFIATTPNLTATQPPDLKLT